MKPLHNPKAGKTRDRKLGVVVVLIIAAGSALGALAISQDHASNSVSGHKMQTASRTDSRSETPPLVRPLSELDPSEQLTRAYVALFDTSRTEDVKSGDYSYSGGKLLQMGGGRWILLAPANHLEAYPVNLGALGIFYLAESEGKFAVKGRWPDFVSGSIMGNPPEWEVRNDVSDHPVVVSTAGGVWQGYSCANMALIELGSEGPRQIAEFPSQYNDSGAKGGNQPVTGIEGRLQNPVKNVRFEVGYEGTRSFTHRYVRRPDGKYALEENDDSVPTC